MSKLKTSTIRTYLEFALMYILISISLVTTLFLVYKGLLSESNSFAEFYNNFVAKWDVKHYINIAKNGYQTTGEDQLLLVFFPFYPICIRILHTITRIDYALCASVISNICAYCSMIMLYKLVLLDYDKDTAYNSVKFYILFPFTFFIFTKMSEGLFLLLLFSTIYNMRKKRYITAGVLGYMLALTRLPGLAVGVIMLTETIFSFCKDIKGKHFTLKKYITRIVMMFTTLCGFLTYLLINYVLHGNPLQFLTYQQSNWSQKFMHPFFIISLVKSQISELYDIGFNLGVGYGNMIAAIFVIAAAIFALFKMKISYSIYTFIYFIVCFSSSWLLSGPRYSLGAFPMFIALGILTVKNKTANTIVTALCCMMMVFFGLLYIPGFLY